MTDLPFSPFSDSLRDVLRRNFIRRAAIWLLGNTENQVVAQAGNSAWEAAMTLTFLSRARALFVDACEEPALCATIARTSPVVTRWLLQRKQVSATGLFNWEGVTWDTAVVIRCLLMMAREYKTSFTSEELAELDRIAVSATKWLCERFATWGTAVKYPFGPADVAQILITLMYVGEHHKHIYTIALEKRDATPTAIIDYLLHTKTTITLPGYAGEDSKSPPPDSCWWGDYFNTAEVLDALGTFHAVNGGGTSLRAGLLEAIRTAIIGGCVYLERTQCDAMWGSHIDTIRALHTYLALPRLLRRGRSDAGPPLLVPEAHTAFKALRWMCDEKQIFADGSMLHTLFLTVFYAHALLEAYDSWATSAKPIEAIYDDVLWETPVRTTPERMRRLAAEITLAEVITQHEQSISREETLVAALHHSNRTLRRVIYSEAVCIVGVPVWLFVSNAFALSKVVLGAKTLTIAITDIGNFITWSTAFAGFITLILGLLWKFEDVFLPAGRR